MADLVFRSTTRGGRDFFEVTDDGMVYGGKDRYNIKTDESMNYADTVDEVLAELVFDGAWRINYDKIEVDELGIGDEYKKIVKLIRKKYNWLYNLPKGSKGRQFYFDIGRYFKQELKKGTDYGKIFDKIDDVIEKNNNFEESKKMNRKSIKEGKTMEYKFLVNKCFVDVYEDSYEEGELDWEKNYYISFDRPCTLDELMRKLSSYGFSDDPSDYMWWNENKYSELMTDALLCEDDTEPSKRELEDWKNGELKLYTHRLSMNIQLIDARDLDAKDAKEFGFQLG